MSEFRLSFPASAIAGTQSMSSNDMRLLRLHSFPNGLQTNDDVITMLALNTSCRKTPPEWERYFVEQLTAYIVYHRAPKGYVDEAKAEWIANVFSTAGVIASPLELEVMLNVIDQAPRVPSSLTCLALGQFIAALREDECGYLIRFGRVNDNPEQALDYLQRTLRHTLGRLATPLCNAERVVLRQATELASPIPRVASWFDGFSSLVNRQDQNRSMAQRHQARRWVRVPDSVFLDKEQPAQK